MKKVLKWLGIILGGLVILVIVAAVGLAIAGTSRLNRTHEIQAEPITVPTDEASLARGEHLVTVACASCHGPNLTGQPLMDDPVIGTVYANNLTGLGETHSDDDLVRAIRHGVARDGRQLIVMPSESFIYFSEEDLSSIIAYLKTVPQSGEASPQPAMAPLGRILVGAGIFGDVFPAEYIDHDTPFPEMPQVGANEAYGQYVSRLCEGCHGPDLSGAQPPDPESPLAPNLAAAGAWSDEQFINTMRTGVTPSGHELDPAFMPWDSFGKLDDDELRGLWMYLASLNHADATTD
ncbi:MAG TPA: c-type cytochrome [Candidatus Sulfomarinibacteraceae bacterium]|nr:c-type cytochrome [Candidatus Sulfomarinibacteraceae bacterium]